MDYRYLPLKPAICKCGHKGKSKRPEYYQCGYCYYSARADSNHLTAQKLRARADKLIEEALSFQAKADAFKTRHEDVGTAW